MDKKQTAFSKRVKKFATAAPFVSDPSCAVTPQTGSATSMFSYTHTASSIVVTQTGLGGTVFDYACFGH